MKALQIRVARNLLGAAQQELEFDKIEDFDRQLQWLQSNVHTAPTPGRQPKGIAVGADLSMGKQVREVNASTARLDVFMKSFLTSSIACRRTLAIYGFLRFQGLEETAPVPKLYYIKVVGTDTQCFFAHLGADCRHASLVTVGQSRELRDNAIMRSKCWKSVGSTPGASVAIATCMVWVRPHKERSPNWQRLVGCPMDAACECTVSLCPVGNA